MVFKSRLWSIAAGALSLAAFAQNAPRTGPIPRDPLELVTGAIRSVDTPAKRAAALQLLDRARSSYALRTAGQAYDLKVTFTVNSGGQTQFDGAWKMHEVFDPRQGLRWTAKASAAYSITRILVNGMLYGDETASYVPLRLQEARAALFGPIPSSENVVRGSIRKSTAILNGARITCVLLSGPGHAASAAPGRRWDETEECIDPQSGLLRTHSQVPGRYYAYKYSNGPGFAGHVLPRKVTVTEAGKSVTEISVDSLTALPAADPSLFVPTEEMTARGRAIEMAEAEKIWRVNGPRPFPPGATAHAVCVFGVVTPAGQLVEAHSLQPSDPNSQAAVEAARQISFAQPPLGAHPQQHFVFVIEKFVSSP
jgi:hypothetical protein